jgi:hypothetical protein
LAEKPADQMKLCHAAALALVGWYLMVPDRDFGAPISTWVQEGSFDTAAQCTDQQSRVTEMLHDPKEIAEQQSKIKGWQAETALKRIEASKCIATDDPRLKEK